MRISKILNDSRNDLLYLCSRFDHFTLQAFAERTELHSTTINNMTPLADGWNWTGGPFRNGLVIENFDNWLPETKALFYVWVTDCTYPVIDFTDSL